MNQLLPQEVVDQIMREEQHFAAAPQAFFEAGSAASRSQARNGLATAPVKA
jgi:hypothetical protein